ncbi:MAG: RNA polymerase sigma factor [Planctomycetota bacterium]|jgi:RNA polymerase sigma-70 factor (ECF subfamily)
MEPEALLAHADFVRGLARSLVFGAQDVDDVVQETWLRTLRSPPRPGPGVRSWLGTVLRNVVRQARRGERRRAVRERAAARPEGSSADAILEREEIRKKVVSAVLGLEEIYREVIVSRYLEGNPPKRIAELLGVPVATVKTRLQRALEKLRDRLDGEHNGDRRAWAVLLLPLAGDASAATTAPRALPRAAIWAAAILVVPVLGIALFSSLLGDGEDGAGPPRDRGAVETAGLPGSDGKTAGGEPGGPGGGEGGDAAGGTSARRLVGAEVDPGGRWRREWRNDDFVSEQVIEFDLGESVMVIDSFTTVPFTRLPNGDLHFTDGAGRTMTYRPSLLGDTLTLTRVSFTAPPRPAGPPPPPIVVVDADGNVGRREPKPKNENDIPKVDLDKGPPREMVLERIPDPDGSGTVVMRLHDAYEDLQRALRNAGPGGVAVSGQDMIRAGGFLRRSRTLREFAKPDVLLESHLAFFEGEDDPELRLLSQYTLASSAEAVRLLLGRRAWRHRSLQCRRDAARVLAVAEGISVEELRDSLGDPADPVVLFALMAKTWHTHGSPPRYLFAGADTVPDEVAAHWRGWLEKEWPKLSKLGWKERRRIEMEEIRALFRSGDPLDQERCAGRLAAFHRFEFITYERLLTKLRTGGREEIEKQLGAEVLGGPRMWGHRLK